MADQLPLRAIGAFDALLARLAVAPAGHSLMLSQRNMGMATIMARYGQSDAIGRALGIDMPDGPIRIETADMALIGTGPGTWLAVSDDADPFWAQGLAGRLEGLASVADQSGGYAVLRLQGAAARDLLSRGAFIDFHPDSFGPGRAAFTMIAHIGVILCRRGDDIFEIALFRSYAQSFWDWLIATATGMGVTPMR